MFLSKPLHYEILFICFILCYVHFIGIYCDVTNLCAISFIDFYLLLQLLAYLFIIPFVLQKVICRLLYPNRDDFKEIDEFCRSRGFEIEEIKIVTDDKYHSIVHRVINPKIKTEKEPIILWHGIGGSGYQWLINSSSGKAENWTKVGDQNVDDSLAITLSNKGYDVFLANLRGNQYSNGHEYLDHNKDCKYWDFGIDEMVKYDCPAVIDRVLQITGRKKTNYVGISMGGMICLGLLADRPEYNTKINKLTTMATGVRFPNSELTSWIPEEHRAAVLNPVIRYLTKNPRNIVPNFIRDFTNYLACGNLLTSSTKLGKIMLYYSCQPLLELFGSRKINLDRMGAIGTHSKIGLSRKMVAHCGQLTLSDNFKKFDYGEENEQIYGSKEVPVYNVKNINAPKLTLVYSIIDRVVSIKDGEYLRDELEMKNVTFETVTTKNYDHFDLILGYNTANVVNVKILKSLS